MHEDTSFLPTHDVIPAKAGTPWQAQKGFPLSRE